MRVLLLTDSLGCPRKGIDASDTWTEKIIQEIKGEQNVVYTYCVHGLSAKMIDIEYIENLAPDLIIVQVGIVDACRRALSKLEISIVDRLPGIRTVIKNFCGNHHYYMSKKRRIHYCSLQTFKEKMTSIASISCKPCVFIRIMPPGQALVKRVYDVKNDIEEYNSALNSIQNTIYIDPFVVDNIDSLQLNDGHHLNKDGHEKVFKAVSDTIKPLI